MRAAWLAIATAACASRQARLDECRRALNHLVDLRHPVQPIDGTVGDEERLALHATYDQTCAAEWPRGWLACVQRARTEAEADACGRPGFVERQELAWDVGDFCARWDGGSVVAVGDLRSPTFIALAERADRGDRAAWARIAALVEASDAPACVGRQPLR